MNLYLDTLQVVGGILTPVLVIVLIRLLQELSAERQQRLEYKRKMLEKQPPFDDEAEFYKVPNNNMQGIRLKKDGVVVWEGSFWKDGRKW